MKTIEKPETIGKPQGNHSKTGKPYENYKKTIGKRGNHRKPHENRETIGKVSKS